MGKKRKREIFVNCLNLNSVSVSVSVTNPLSHFLFLFNFPPFTFTCPLVIGPSFLLTRLANPTIHMIHYKKLLLLAICSSLL